MSTLEVAAPPSPQRDPASVEAGDPEPQSPERGPESREDPAAPAGSLGLSEPGPRSSEDVQSLPPSNTGVAEDLQGGSSAVHIVPPRGSRMSRDSRSMDGSTPAGDGHPVPPGGETMRRHSMDGDDGDSQKKTVPSVTGMDVEPDEATLAQTGNFCSFDALRHLACTCRQGTPVHVCTPYRPPRIHTHARFFAHMRMRVWAHTASAIRNGPYQSIFWKARGGGFWDALVV